MDLSNGVDIAKKIIQTGIVMKFPARILGALFAFILVLFVAKTSFAQTVQSATAPQQNNQQSQYLAPNTNPDVPKNLHTYTQNVIIEVMSAVICQITGTDPINRNQQCLGIDPRTGKLGYAPGGGGAIGFMGNMITGLYTVPVHVGGYFADVSNDFGIAKKADAQVTGVGFEGLRPVLPLWKTFRDIAYLMFIVLFIFIGIAIMLRVRIDPRTVMTIQNQIPKLVIGIIMVTFSYAIAGFLIDLMWLGNYAVISVIDKSIDVSKINQGAPGFANYIFEPKSGEVSCPGGLLNVACGASGGIRALIISIFKDAPDIKPETSTRKQEDMSPPDLIKLGGCLAIAPLCLISNLFSGGTGFLVDAVGNIVWDIASWIIAALAFLIITIAILWALIRLWFTLIKAYVFILIDVILAPFWIVAGLFPRAGPSVGFGGWIRDLVANLLVFPVVIGLFAFGEVVMHNFGSAPTPNQFNPPLIGGVGATSNIGPLIALGVILMSPSIAETIKKTVKASGVGLGGAGQYLGTGQAIVGGFIGGTSAKLFQRDQYGRPIGAGATFVSTHINNPITRGIFGWREQHFQTGHEKDLVEAARQRGGSSPKQDEKSSDSGSKRETNPTSDQGKNGGSTPPAGEETT